MHVVGILLVSPSSPSLFVSPICWDSLFGASLTQGLSGNGLHFLLKLCMSGGYVVFLWAQDTPCTAVGAWSRQWDVEVGAQPAKGWHFHGHHRSGKYWLAAPSLWGLSRRGWQRCCTAGMEMGTWWDWLEEEMCGLRDLWNGKFPLRLSTARVRFLQDDFFTGMQFLFSSWLNLNQE